MIFKLTSFLNALSIAFPVPTGVNNHCITLLLDDRTGNANAPKRLGLQLFLETGERKCFYFGENDFDRPLTDIITELRNGIAYHNDSV